MRREMKSIIAVFLTVFTLVACGASIKVGDINLGELTAHIVENQEITEELRGITAQELETYYDLSSGDYVQFSGLISGIGTSAQEIIFIEAKDANIASMILEKAELRLEEKLRQAEGYLPEEYALIEKGIVRKDGNYVALFVAPDVEAVELSYEEQIYQ